MIELIICDMDGTLLDDEKNLPSGFWELEKRLNENNILLAIASGRQYYNLAHLFKTIKDRCVFIAENGTLVMFQDECLYMNTLTKEDASLLVHIGKKIDDTDVIYCGLKSAYIENDNEELWEYASKYYKHLQLVKSLDDVNDDCLKITICDYKGSKDNSNTHFRHLEEDFKIAVSGKIWLDITHKDANKGNAIQRIQKKFKISFDKTMVFGDYLNDLEMMRNGKYSYAMKNAEPEIVAAANFQTKYTNNESGVVHTIKEVIFNE